jgi:transposase
MQGKKTIEPKSCKSSAGIDVSKTWLDVHVLPAGERRRFGNDAAGIKSLKRWLKPFQPEAIALEATGKWHRPLARSLSADAMPLIVVDAYRVRCFAHAEGIAAKTDQLDAYVLALFAAFMPLEFRPLTPESIAALAELATARDSAVEEQTSLKNQRAAATSRFLKAQLKRRIAQLAKHIEGLAAAIAKRIAAEAGLARRQEILTSIIGFGPVVAATLIACLSELGSLTRKQITRLAGLAPMADDSGQRKGLRVIKGGRPAVRRALFLAALSACRHDPNMKAFYDRLIAEGKAAKVALIAVARKRVILANALIAEDRTYQLEAPKHP